MKISVLDVSKRFGDFAALDRVNLEVRSGELLALLGPSGSGKTTLLRIVAGLEWPDQGEVRFDGEDALSRSVGERHVGFVFHTLFRHMTVFRTSPSACARDLAGIADESEIRRRVSCWILCRAGSPGDTLPTSGRQRQVSRLRVRCD